MKSIDLNCDVGEGMGLEAEILPLVSSANIACGAHAGDEATMTSVSALARKSGVVVGAHPGFADRTNFGRTEIRLPSADLEKMVIAQLAALGRCGEFRYVKPHGALYNMAARDEGVARTVVAAVKAYDPGLWLMGLAGSALLRAAEESGLTVVPEAFADRHYDDHGALVNRARPDAVIRDQAEVVNQVLEIVLHQRVKSTAGSWVTVDARSICLHGDNPPAVQFARSLRQALAGEGIAVESFLKS